MVSESAKSSTVLWFVSFNRKSKSASSPARISLYAEPKSLSKYTVSAPSEIGPIKKSITRNNTDKRCTLFLMMLASILYSE